MTDIAKQLISPKNSCDLKHHLSYVLMSHLWEEEKCHHVNDWKCLINFLFCIHTYIPKACLATVESLLSQTSSGNVFCALAWNNKKPGRCISPRPRLLRVTQDKEMHSKLNPYITERWQLQVTSSHCRLGDAVRLHF